MARKATRPARANGTDLGLGASPDSTNPNFSTVTPSGEDLAFQGEQIYDGRFLIGSILKGASDFYALRANGKRVGSFPTRTEAMRAIVAAAKAETSR